MKAQERPSAAQNAAFAYDQRQSPINHEHERKPVAFGDLRGWIKALDGAGELQRVEAEVDWDIELGTIARLAQGAGTGPALLFSNIRDYGANARCRQVFTGGLSSARRVAMMFGMPPDTHPRELVKLGRTVLSRQRAAENRRHRSGEGEHRQGRRRRSLRIAGAAMEPRSTAAATL